MTPESAHRALTEIIIHFAPKSQFENLPEDYIFEDLPENSIMKSARDLYDRQSARQK